MLQNHAAKFIFNVQSVLVENLSNFLKTFKTHMLEICFHIKSILNFSFTLILYARILRVDKIQF